MGHDRPAPCPLVLDLSVWADWCNFFQKNKKNTAVDESRKKIADRVASFPARLCSRDGKLCYYRHLEYVLLAFFLPCFLLLFFSVFIRACFSSRFFVLSASSAPLQQVLYVCIVSCQDSFYFRSIFLYFFIFFVVVIFLVGVFVVSYSRTRYVGM